ncbi:SMI1/KNR4 family protein [Pseudalkalibacillus sp. SCS-8]|uniref:SMI1/KNR4 family protein n=1 Tax=Pseudalkalibacillus nanhaiensis TaxID=3115291 RepID=UPI0032DABC6E
MSKFEELTTKWENLIDELEEAELEVEVIESEGPASPEEILEAEKKLNMKLPPSYKDFILNVSKRLHFAWYLPEEDMELVPEELGEIYQGEIHIDFDVLEDLTHFADDWYEDGVDHGVHWRNKIAFAHASNGDLYTFDGSNEREEKPVYYLEHEGEDAQFLAESFIDYLERITELFVVGTELWHFEAFLDETGINTKSANAEKWKKWFTTYIEENS